VFHEPEGIHRGRDETDQVAGAIRVAQPGLRNLPVRAREEMYGAARGIWRVAGHPGAIPAHSGTDLIVERDGRIATVHLFFHPVPA
jgi:hypothetical protein